jgi:hypothetical protein
MPNHDTPTDPADPELAAMLAAVTGPGGEFRHRQHINLAFLAVRRYGMPEATGKVCSWIRRIAAYERAPQKYHHTVSRAWVELVAHHVAANPDCADFEVFARENPALLDKRLLIRHYRSSTLAAGQPRQGWVEPDLLPFPRSALGSAAGRLRCWLAGLVGHTAPQGGGGRLDIGLRTPLGELDYAEFRTSGWPGCKPGLDTPIQGTPSRWPDAASKDMPGRTARRWSSRPSAGCC